MFIEILDALLSERGLSRNKMLNDLGLNKSSALNWESRGTIPSGDVLSKIADYFDPSTLGEQTVTQGSCSISYKGQPEVKVGGSYKTFTAQFFDSNGNEIFDTPVWTLTTIKPEYDDKFKTVTDGNKIKIKADNILDMIGDQILLEASTSDGSISAQIYVKVVSLYG